MTEFYEPDDQTPQLPEGLRTSVAKADAWLHVFASEADSPKWLAKTLDRVVIGTHKLCVEAIRAHAADMTNFGYSEGEVEAVLSVTCWLESADGLEAMEAVEKAIVAKQHRGARGEDG